MSLNCGIVGLPNVGKSTIFQAITSAPAEAANYPFCTIEPNIGIIAVPDERLEQITKFIKPQKIIPAVVEFVDIAGLVAGASKGEGLGNQFLGHIRQVGILAHVVRCFDHGDIIHVAGKVDPLSDIEVINIELCLSDLETVQKRKQNLIKNLKSQNKEIREQAQLQSPLLDRLEKGLESGLKASLIGFNPEEEQILKDLHLITLKKTLYVCNVDENSVKDGNNYVRQVEAYAAKHGEQVVTICGSLESEIAALNSPEEKKEFLATMNLNETGLQRLIKKVYQMLGLRTYFTAGEKEVRAWTFFEGMKAPQCAGVIHTDFERGFIKAEVFHVDDLLQFQSEAKVKEAGKLRIEGKEYVVRDGDIMHFRFNV